MTTSPESTRSPSPPKLVTSIAKSIESPRNTAPAGDLRISTFAGRCSNRSCLASLSFAVHTAGASAASRAFTVTSTSLVKVARSVSPGAIPVS